VGIFLKVLAVTAGFLVAALLVNEEKIVQYLQPLTGQVEIDGRRPTQRADIDQQLTRKTIEDESSSKQQAELQEQEQLNAQRPETDEQFTTGAIGDTNSSNHQTDNFKKKPNQKMAAGEQSQAGSAKEEAQQSNRYKIYHSGVWSCPSFLREFSEIDFLNDKLVRYTTTDAEILLNWLYGLRTGFNLAAPDNKTGDHFGDLTTPDFVRQIAEYCRHNSAGAIMDALFEINQQAKGD
jgi:hypothetical protein